jgi:hypothetical protein
MLLLIRTCTYFIHTCLCAQSTQKTAASKATADQKSAQKQPAKADTDDATAKETSEESKDAEKAGGEEAAEDSEKEEEGGSAEISAAKATLDAESSDDGDETGRCVVCKGSKSIGKVSIGALFCACYHHLL